MIDSQNIKVFHEGELEKIGIPKWANVKCPFCKEEQPLRSIRSVSLKFNPRNMGDLAVEVFCEKCCLMDTVYFRKEFNNIKDAIAILDGQLLPKNEPIIEEDMYKMRYNNVVEEMMKKKVIGD